MESIKERADHLRVRLFALIGHGSVKQTADAMGWSRGFTSRLLNAREDNDNALRRVEKYCEALEAEQQAEAA